MADNPARPIVSGQHKGRYRQAPKAGKQPFIPTTKTVHYA